MKKLIQKPLLLVGALAILLLVTAAHDPRLLDFAKAATGTLDASNDWLLFQDATDGKLYKLHPSSINSSANIASDSWSGSATITSSQDTLLNGSVGYGQLQRIGDVIFFTLRYQVGLGAGGGANTIYITPPVASNFTQESADVIGTANLDSQGQSTANTPRQRALLFASTSDDKIAVAYDPVGSLTYPENRVYISVSGSYIVQ